MTERKKPGAPFLRVIDNPNFVDKVEEEAKALVEKLIADFALMSKQSGVTFRQCIEVPFWPANDKVVDRACEILSARNWSADPLEHRCAGGRAGAFWLMPPNNWKVPA